MRRPLFRLTKQAISKGQAKDVAELKGKHRETEYELPTDDPALHSRRVRRANPVSVDSIFEVTASQYAASADEYVGFRSRAAGRDVAAYFCRGYTSATLRELSDRFALSHPDSASDLIRRGAKRIEQSSEAVRQ